MSHLSPATVINQWLERITQFEEDRNGSKIVIGNLLPYSCIPFSNYYQPTRTFSYYVPSVYLDFITPTRDEARVAREHGIYYMIIRR